MPITIPALTQMLVPFKLTASARVNYVYVEASTLNIPMTSKVENVIPNDQ